MSLKFEYGYQFERLWKSYPLHVAKMAAYKAFQKLKLTDAEVDELVLHVERRKKDDVRWLGDGSGKRFIPHLATFLNQHRFEDDYQRARNVPHASHREFAPDAPPQYASDETAKRYLDELRRTLH